jgi:hypothetical protein
MFWRQFPEYEHYWVIEHDVRYTGAWHELFDAFADSRADLLGTTLVRYADCPQWQWWRTLALADGDVPRERALRGFFPVYRISARALAGLHEAYVAGCRGHMETLMPTVISLQGLVLEDIGGSGPFVRSGNQERFYTNDPTSESLAPGSFVYRPILEAPGVVPGKLWHPVKTPEPPLLRWVNHALRWGYIAGRQALLSIHRRLQSNVADRRQP